MKLVEEGKVRLDDPVKDYVPEIDHIMVLEGFDPDGQPRLRKPKTDVTINMLMLHTSPNPHIILPQTPEMDMGGHGLYASIGEYMKFIRMILNDGSGVLNSETVSKMAQNGLGDLKSGGWVSSDPTVVNDGEFFPGFQKSWSYTFQVNEKPLPTGRPAGQFVGRFSQSFYWIDRENGIGGFWATQMFPFQDQSSYLGYLEFESAVYQNIL